MPHQNSGRKLIRPMIRTNDSSSSGCQKHDGSLFHRLARSRAPPSDARAVLTKLAAHCNSGLQTSIGLWGVMSTGTRSRTTTTTAFSVLFPSAIRSSFVRPSVRLQPTPARRVIGALQSGYSASLRSLVLLHDPGPIGPASLVQRRRRRRQTDQRRTVRRTNSGSRLIYR